MSRKFGFYELTQKSKYWTMRAKTCDNKNVISIVERLGYNSESLPEVGFDLVVYECDSRNMYKYVRSCCLFERYPREPEKPSLGTVPIIRNDFLSILQSMGCSDRLYTGSIRNVDGQLLDWRTYILHDRIPFHFYRQTKLQKKFVVGEMKDKLIVDGMNLGCLVRSDVLDHYEAYYGIDNIAARLSIPL